MQDDVAAPFPHMWPEGYQFSYLLLYRQTQPELFMLRNFPEWGHIPECGYEMIFVGTGTDNFKIY